MGWSHQCCYLIVLVLLAKKANDLERVTIGLVIPSVVCLEC